MQPADEHSSIQDQPAVVQLLQEEPVVQISTTCPPGLEELTQLDQLFIQQQVEGVQVPTGLETRNRYDVFNSRSEPIFYAFEESSSVERSLWGKWRDYTLHIVRVDNTNEEVMCMDGGSQEINIEAPPGSLVGSVVQHGWCWSSSFRVLDVKRSPVYSIGDPSSLFGCRCGVYDFDVINVHGGATIGRITKQDAGFIQGTFANTDNYAVSFPRDMDVRHKATLLGALFLIDFVFFEKSHRT